MLNLEEFYRDNKIIKAYLDGGLSEYHDFSFSKENLMLKADQREFDGNIRKVLVDHLNQQYTGLTVSQSTQTNIDRLNESNVYTVTTGHQCNIFGGPMFFIYKILQVINICEELNASGAEKKFVPVFWMASEDHDLEEIASVNVFHEKLKWEREQEGAVGRMSLEGMTEVLDSIQSKFRDDEGKQLFDIFQSYIKEESLAKATLFLVNALFGKFGLVVLDADSPSLKAIFSETMKSELLDSTSWNAINQTISEFENLNYKVQVTPREINLFYLSNGSRNRIVKEGGEFQIVDTEIQFTEAQILDELQIHPEKFSPNVVMRPMYQETILPNIAYLGGAGEIAYWLEFKRAFEEYGISFPILIVRNSLVLMDRSVNKKLSKTGLDPIEFLKKEDVLIKDYLKSHSDEIDFDDELDKLGAIKETLVEKSLKIDAGLKGNVEATFAKFEKELGKMESRFIRSLKQKSENELNAIKAVNAKFYPNGTFQERFENFTPYYINFGSKFLDLIKNEVGAFEQRLKFVDLEQYSNPS